jgi:hypothetical protein
MLSIDPFDKRRWPKVTGGVSGKRIFHLVFPTEVVAAPWPVVEIQSRALSLFEKWGGESVLRRLFPNVPALSGPRPVVIEPPAVVTEATPNRLPDEEAAFPRIKAQDVPKSELDF